MKKLCGKMLVKHEIQIANLTLPKLVPRSKHEKKMMMSTKQQHQMKVLLRSIHLQSVYYKRIDTANELR